MEHKPSFTPGINPTLKAKAKDQKFPLNSSFSTILNLEVEVGQAQLLPTQEAGLKRVLALIYAWFSDLVKKR